MARLLYVVFVIDAFARRIVGWGLSNCMSTAFVPMRWSKRPTLTSPGKPIA
jgi:hypothetical protein